MQITDTSPDGRHIRSSHPIEQLLEQYGQMPLPPYISYDDHKANPYQPIFAQHPGSVASPTASLHFTPHLIQNLAQRQIPLHSIVLHV